MFNILSNTFNYTQKSLWHRQVSILMTELSILPMKGMIDNVFDYSINWNSINIGLITPSCKKSMYYHINQVKLNLEYSDNPMNSLLQLPKHIEKPQCLTVLHTYMLCNTLHMLSLMYFLCTDYLSNLDSSKKYYIITLFSRPFQITFVKLELVII